MPDSRTRRVVSSIKLPLYFLLLLWVIHILQTFLFPHWIYNGIYPGRFDRWWGIFTSPLIHADFGHLISNSGPLFVLGAIMLFFYRRIAVVAFILIYLLTGALVWLFANGGNHVGASGVVYGMVAFVFWNGIFRRNLKSIVLALVVMLLFHGMIVGIVPSVGENISWESHLMGGLVGVLVSYLLKEQIEDDEQDRPQYLNEEQDPQYFLDRDVFEKTKRDRELDQR